MTLDRAGVFGGVDTHKDVHVAAAVDAAGRLLGTAEFAADSRGYDQLAGWLESWGAVGRVGVEGNRSYGAGLTRHLAAAGVEVVEVNRPNRQTRRRRAKTDTVDAETAARAALNGDATAVPKSADGCVEAIRTLSLARRSAVKARTVAANQINAVAVTAPEHLKDRLRDSRRLRWSRSAPGGASAPPAIPPPVRPNGHCGRWRAATGRSQQRSRDLTQSCSHCASGPTRRCWAPAASAPRSPQRCWSPPGTTPSGCAAKRRSPRSAGPAPSRRHQGPGSATGSTAAATAKPTTPCGASRWSACASTSAASTTPRAAEPRARPDARSSAASSATSHARYTGCSPTRPRSHTARACASSAPDAGSPSTPQPKPSTPTPPASQHSNGASTTTATSPNATVKGQWDLPSGGQ